MPVEWFKSATTGREAEEQHGRGPGRPRTAAEASECNNNQRDGEDIEAGGGGEEDIGGCGGGGAGAAGEAGDMDESQESGAESQESGAEEVLKRSWKRSRPGGSDDPDPDWVEARIPKDILQDIMPVALREGLSIRQTVVMLSAVLTSAGVDLEEINLSRSTCHRRLVESAEAIGENGLNEYVEEVQNKNVGVVCHFDGKLMEEDFQRRRQSNSRLVFMLNSPWVEGEHLVGVAPLEVESGYAIALEVYEGLLQLGVEDRVIGAVYDSTGINTGEEEGASIHLERLLDRPILEVECTHHQQVRD